MKKYNFFQELKRRNVYKVAITYALASWLILQIGSIVLPTINAPEWVMQALLFFLLIGFPIALILAWAFEMSPEGIIRTTSVEDEENPVPKEKKKLHTSNAVIGILLLVVAGQFIHSRYFNSTETISSNIDKSIAVLPFINESSNQENQYFCNGVMQAIINNLSKIENLRVIPRTSVEEFRAVPLVTRQIEQKLNVGYILQGSVQRIDQRAIIFANLIEAKNERSIWSMTYDRGLQNIFAVQFEITEKIADEIQVLITKDVKKRLEVIPTTSTIAYDYYLMGNEYLGHEFNATQTSEEWHGLLDSAKMYFTKSIQEDSLFAEAIAGLAKVDLLRNKDLNIMEEDYLESVLNLTNKAIEINPDLSEAYLIRSQYYFFNSMEERAQIDIERTIQLNPNNIDAYYRLSESAYSSLDFEKAIGIFNRIENKIRTLDEKYQFYDRLWWFYIQIGDIERSEEYGLKKYALKPKLHTGMWLVYGIADNSEKFLEWIEKDFPNENQFKLAMIGSDFLQRKKFEECVPIYEKWEKLVALQSEDNMQSHESWKRYGMALDQIGQKKRGKMMLQKAIDGYTKRIALGRYNDVNAMYSLAGVYAYLQDYELSFYWLDKFESEDGWRKASNLAIWMQHDIFLDNLRNIERFQKIEKNAIRQQAEIQKKVRDLVL